MQVCLAHENFLRKAGVIAGQGKTDTKTQSINFMTKGVDLFGAPMVSVDKSESDESDMAYFGINLKTDFAAVSSALLAQKIKLKKIPNAANGYEAKMKYGTVTVSVERDLVSIGCTRGF